MKKAEDKKQKYLHKEGELEKLSSSIFLGYQKKFWRVLHNGKKLGYRNLNDTDFKPENVFDIKYCTATEVTGEGVFELTTEKRNFTLKALNNDEQNDWIKAITYLRKACFKSKTKKPEPSPTETTIATQAEKQQRSPSKKIKTGTQTSLKIQSPLRKNLQNTPESLNTQSSESIIQQLKKHMPSEFVKYHTLLTNLKTKSQGLIGNSFKNNLYLLISPKSLYPDVHISEQNLTNRSIPPWIYLNKFYKMSSGGGKQKCKEVLEVQKILSIEPNMENCSLKVNTGEIIFEFFTDTSIEMQLVCKCLQYAVDNAFEVMVKGEMKKKNYDRLVDAHETDVEIFRDKARDILAEYIPDQIVYKYQPQVLIQFMESIVIFLKQFITILESKKKNKNHVILDMLIIFHEQVKIQIKLTWDSSYLKIQAIHVLKILRCLSQYHEIVQPFIKSMQFLEGMRELSKIYVRVSWKNFQNIITNIVEQEKKANFFQDQFSQYLETNGVNDLFKFIYEVFDLAHPHWKSKVHLHNVNRLMQRALTIFINEIRSVIDQEVIPEKQMVALANNYFRFKQCVNEFYQEKFASSLAERTKQAYEKAIKNYKQVSMIIIEKLSLNFKFQLDMYTEGKSLSTIKTDQIVRMLCIYHENYEKLLHMAFVRKLHENFVAIVHRKIIDLISAEARKKKKSKVKDVVKYVQMLKKELEQIFHEMSKMDVSFRKKIDQIEHILSFDLYTDIQDIIAVTSEPLRSQYLKVMELRQDFYEGSALNKIVTEAEQHPKMMKSTKSRKYSANEKQVRNKSLSKQYLEEDDDNKSETSQGPKQSTNQKLISEGYMIKGKRNQKVWEKQYFRLKNGFLYVYDNKDSERCQNSIDLKNMLRIDVNNPDKPSFILGYNNLGKQKEIKLKCEDIETRVRWINSIQLEKRRLENEKEIKKKAVKLKETGRKKNQLIIDYEELDKGKDYFSYSN